MSHSISSSDTEDESHTPDKLQKSQKEREWKYECPADFVPFKYSCHEGTKVEERGENTELWLIKAPASFNHKSFDNLKLSFSSLEMIQPAGSSKIYSVLSSQSAPADLRLLISSGETGNASVCSSGFTGVLNISESYGDCSQNQNPIPVPAAPAPSIPPGLRQRFQPFGCSKASHVLENTSPLKRVKQEPEAVEERRKKKKKKDKHSSESEKSTEVVMHIKQEDLWCEPSEVQDPDLVEEAGRKKRKKKKEREARQDEEVVDSSLILKEEPVDTSYDHTDSSVKKKKKKKKRALDE